MQKKNNMKNKIILLLFLLITITLNGADKKSKNTQLIEENNTFTIYQEKADLYLKRKYFKGTPITGQMLAKSAKKAYDSTGILLPLELALSQAQWESDMGLKGKSPKKNPFNIGEWGDTTVIKFKTTEKGIEYYYLLMTKNYLKCKTVDELLNNFVNCNGHRYAKSEKYEQKIKNQYRFIKTWLDKNYLTNDSTHCLTIQNIDN